MAEQVVAVGMGSNLGDRFGLLKAAAEALGDLPQSGKLLLSGVYESRAMDCPEPLPFLNAAAVFHTRLGPRDLLERLLKVEQRFGRRRPYPNAPRPLDLDLLLYGEQVIGEEDVVVPHPRMHERLFVLTPLAEIAADHLHPLLGKTVGRLDRERRRQAQPGDVILQSHLIWPIDLQR